MKVHPITKLFPPMTEAEFADLKASVKAQGVLQPAWTFRGELIDGFHRKRACDELGIPLPSQEWDGVGSLTDFVVALNRKRRHLTDDQRVAIAAEIEEWHAKEAAERAKEAGRIAGKNQGHRGAEGGRGNKKETPPGQICPGGVSEKKTPVRAAETAAAEMAVKRRRVQTQKAIKNKAPDLHEKVKGGTLKHSEAVRELQRREKRQEAETKAAAAPPASELNAEVITGDTVAVMNAREAGTVRLAFADPPYNIGIDYGAGKAADMLAPEQYMAWCERWMRAAARLLTDDGSLWVLISDEFAAEYKIVLERSGLVVRQWIIWFESFGVNCSNKFNRTHRHLFWCVKDAKRFVFNREAFSRPSDRQTKYNDARADPAGKLWDSVWGINPAIPRLVDNAKERLPDFPTQLPLSLLMPIVAGASDPGDLVFDVFSGSASMGEAAISQGRRFVGVELSPKFAEASRLRLAAVVGRMKEGAA